MKTIATVVTLIALACVVAAGQPLPDLTQADVFATFNGPLERFEALMKGVDAALVS
jgi:hypothetical protein